MATQHIYVKKKLPHFQVHRVISRTRLHGDQMLRHINAPFVIDGVPQGHYCATGDSILLPKRRRGEKFIVHYTVMREAIL